MSDKKLQRATFDLLKPKTYEFELEAPAGEDPFLVELRDLTLSDVLSIDAANPQPSPPVSDIRKDENGTFHNVHNFEDATYKAAREEWMRNRMTLLIVRAWITDIPGDTDAEKCDAINTQLATWARSGLWRAVEIITQGKEDAVRMRPFPTS